MAEVIPDPVMTGILCSSRPGPEVAFWGQIVQIQLPGSYAAYSR